MPTYHCFSVEIAVRYGILEAVLLENIKYWVDKNRANGKNIFDGRPWTYNSVKAFTELFPYASDGQIRRALKKLESEGLLLTGNYNKLPYDRTIWYALTDYAETIFSNGNPHFSILQNGTFKNDKPIPDINTDINTNNNTHPCQDVNTPTSGGLPTLQSKTVENSVETVENAETQAERALTQRLNLHAENVIGDFKISYAYFIGKPHGDIPPDKLKGIKQAIIENGLNHRHIAAYFGDNGAGGTKPLYGDSDAKIYHFVSPGVVEILKRRCGE